MLMKKVMPIRIIIYGKTEAELKGAGIRLKPLNEVRLDGEGKNYLKSVFREADVQMSGGNFDCAEGLGLTASFYHYKIAAIAQRYQKNTSHRMHIDGLRKAAKLSWFQTAMIILDAARNLDINAENRSFRIQKSLEVARKIADGLFMGEGENAVDRLEGSEFEKVRLGAEEVGRMNRREQVAYPFTHRKDMNGDWKLITD